MEKIDDLVEKLKKTIGPEVSPETFAVLLDIIQELVHAVREIGDSTRLRYDTLSLMKESNVDLIEKLKTILKNQS